MKTNLVIVCGVLSFAFVGGCGDGTTNPGTDSGGIDTGVSPGDTGVSSPDTGADAAIATSDTGVDGGSVASDTGVDAPISTVDSGADANTAACSGMDCAAWAPALTLAPRDASGTTMAQAVGNCVVQVHQSDCCGARRAYGVNHAARGSAGMPGLCQAETTCRAGYPASPGCSSALITVDTGDTTMDMNLVRVRGVPATPCPTGVCVQCQTVVCAAGDATCLSLEGITATQCG